MNIDHMLNKLLSGRLIMVIIFSATYCLVIIGCVILAMMKLMSIEAFLGIFSGFSAIMLLIAKSYYERQDREKTTNEGGK